MMFRQLFREPLLYFFAIGSALLLVDQARATQSSRPEVIEIPADYEAVLRKQLADEGKNLTQDDLNGYIDAFVTDEVLYREALKLGLEKSDTIVRRRLIQKMMFILKDSAEPSLSDSELQAWLDAHPSEYLTPERRVFEHVFVSRQRHDDAKADAEAAVLSLRQDDKVEGDPAPIEVGLNPTTKEACSAAYGKAFADALWSLPLNDWSEPVPSVFGYHIVRMTEVIPATQQKLENIKNRLSARVRNERREEAYRQKLKELIAKTTIVRVDEGSP